MNIYLNKNINTFANNKKVRSVATKLCSASSILPVVLLEGAVIGGRTYQADKRGGKIEARERLTEECVSGVIWLWGMQTINKGFDYAIDKFGGLKQRTGLKDFNFDTGKDAVRKPFEHATKGLTDKSKKLISAMKFSKIVASAALSIGFMGFVLPKINQQITTNMLNKMNSDDSSSKNRTQSPSITQEAQEQKQNMQRMDIQQFLTMARGEVGDPNEQQDKTPFKGGGAFFQTAAHSLENDSITQLLTMDSGLFTGRAVSARNKHERKEILFRDLASSFFYVASTPLVYMGLTQLDPYRGKNTNLAPNIAEKLDTQIRQELGIKDANSKVKTGEFKAKILGQRVVPEKVISDANEMFSSKKSTVTLDEMQNFITKSITDESLAQTLKDKTAELSKLQPELDNKNIITKSQVHNIFHDGLLNEPKVINKLIDDAAEGSATNPIKFISQKKVDSHRKDIVSYAESILEKAKKHGDTHINKNVLDHMKNRHLVTKLGYWGAGMAVSGYCLSTLIPKIQYAMTKKATGQDGFPGVTNYQTNPK